MVFTFEAPARECKPPISAILLFMNRSEDKHESCSYALVHLLPRLAVSRRVPRRMCVRRACADTLHISSQRFEEVTRYTESKQSAHVKHAVAVQSPREARRESVVAITCTLHALLSHFGAAPTAKRRSGWRSSALPDASMPSRCAAHSRAMSSRSLSSGSDAAAAGSVTSSMEVLLTAGLE